MNQILIIKVQICVVFARFQFTSVCLYNYILETLTVFFGGEGGVGCLFFLLIFEFLLSSFQTYQTCCHYSLNNVFKINYKNTQIRTSTVDYNNNSRIERRYSRFFTISSQRRELSPTRTLKWPGRNSVQITCNTSSAYHVQVSCYVPLGTKGQLSY